MSVVRVTVSLVSALAVIVCAASTVTDATGGTSPICTRGLTTVARDPRLLLPIGGSDPIGAATAAALRSERPAYRPQVQSASRAIFDAGRGPQAKYSCGVRVWRRTIVVYIIDRAMLPAQSASQRVYFVGRFADGYRVWQMVH